MYHCKQHCTLLIYLYIYISHSKTHQLDSTKSTHQQINTSPLLRIASNTPLSTQHQSHSVWGGVCGVCVENSQCSSKTPHSQNTPTRHHQIDTSTDKHLASFEDRIQHSVNQNTSTKLVVWGGVCGVCEEKQKKGTHKKKKTLETKASPSANIKGYLLE